MLSEDAIEDRDFPTDLVELSKIILTVSNHIGEGAGGIIIDPDCATGWHCILNDIASDLDLISNGLKDDKKKGGKS